MKASTLLLAACHAVLVTATPIPEKSKLTHGVKEVGSNFDFTKGTYPSCDPAELLDCGDKGVVPILHHSPRGPCIQFICGKDPGIGFASFSENDAAAEEGLKESRDIKQFEANADLTRGGFPTCDPGNVRDCGKQGSVPVVVDSPRGPCVRYVCGNGGKPGIGAASVAMKDSKLSRDDKQFEANADFFQAYEPCKDADVPNCGERSSVPILVRGPRGRCIKFVCASAKSGSQSEQRSITEFGEELDDDNSGHDYPPPKNNGGPPPSF